jgi:hypothetical protein
MEEIGRPLDEGPSLRTLSHERSQVTADTEVRSFGPEQDGRSRRWDEGGELDDSIPQLFRGRQVEGVAAFASGEDQLGDRPGLVETYPLVTHVGNLGPT